MFTTLYDDIRAIGRQDGINHGKTLYFLEEQCKTTWVNRCENPTIRSHQETTITKGLNNEEYT